jgi:hypothetical protein
MWMRNACRIFVGKQGRIKPIGIPRLRWVDNIEMDIIGRMGWYGLDCSGSG